MVPTPPSSASDPPHHPSDILKLKTPPHASVKRLGHQPLVGRRDRRLFALGVARDVA